MSCFAIDAVEDKEITGECPQCEGDVNQDGEYVGDNCSYSPVECETCGCQPCDLSC